MKAYFAGGCFWCMTPVFRAYGAEKVVCGYSGGKEKDPVYSDVKAQKTAGRFPDQLDIDQLDIHFVGDPFCDFPGFPDRHRLARQPDPSHSIKNICVSKTHRR